MRRIEKVLGLRGVLKYSGCRRKAAGGSRKHNIRDKKLKAELLSFDRNGGVER